MGAMASLSKFDQSADDCAGGGVKGDGAKINFAGNQFLRRQRVVIDDEVRRAVGVTGFMDGGPVLAGFGGLFLGANAIEERRRKDRQTLARPIIVFIRKRPIGIENLGDELARMAIVA